MEILAIPLILIMVVIVVMIPVFWIWMLVDCLSKESSEGNDKIVWALVIFFGNVFGALLYFFIRRPQRKQLMDH